MAASSKLIGLRFFTRSVAQFRPVVAAGSRFCSTKSIAGDRLSKNDPSINRPAYRSKSFNDFALDRFSTTRTTNTLNTPSLSNTVLIKPWRTVEGPECLHYVIHMVGASAESVKVSVQGNTVIVEAHMDERFIKLYGYEKYVCNIDIPHNMYKLSDITAEAEDNSGVLELTIPKLKPDEINYDVKVNVTPPRKLSDI